MTTGKFRGTFLMAVALTLIFPLIGRAGGKEAKKMEIQGGILDDIHLKVEQIEGGLPVVIRRFSTEGVELGSGAEGGKESRVKAVQEVVTLGPEMLASQIATSLKEGGVFTEVITDDGAPVPEKALIIEGQFVLIDPGSRAKRYWAGFGAGKSGVGVEGKVTNAAGEVLAEFRHRKHSGIGVGGGDYFKFLSDDTKDIGKDLATFLARWATGKSLKD